MNDNGKQNKMTKDSSEFANEIFEMIQNEQLLSEHRRELVSSIAAKLREYSTIEKRLLKKRIQGQLSQLKQTDGMVKIEEVKDAIEKTH